MKVVFDESGFDEIDHFHPNFDESVPNRTDVFVLAFWCQELERLPASACVEASLWGVWVGGEPGKTAGPVLQVPLQGAGECQGRLPDRARRHLYAGSIATH